MADSLEGSWNRGYRLKSIPKIEIKRPLKICTACESCGNQHDFILGEVPRLCCQCWTDWQENKWDYGCTYKEWLAQKRLGRYNG